LYNEILDDYEFSQLSDSGKYHLLAIFLLASRTSNRIPWDQDWIKARIGAGDDFTLKPLFDLGFIEPITKENQTLQEAGHDASGALAERKQDDTVTVPSVEKRREEKRREEKRRRFKPPSVDQVRSYCDERKNNIDPDAFVDHYIKTGWMSGKNKIKDWKACVRTWERRDKQDAPEPRGEVYL